MALDSSLAMQTFDMPNLSLSDDYAPAPPPSPDGGTPPGHISLILHTPQDNEEWRWYRVSAEKGLIWTVVECLWHIHVQKTPKSECFLVAIADSHIQDLRDRKLKFESAEVEEYSPAEGRVHGIHEAKQRYSYVQNHLPLHTSCFSVSSYRSDSREPR